MILHRMSPSSSSDAIRRRWLAALDRVMLADRWTLSQRIARWNARPDAAEQSKIDGAIERSLARAGERAALRPVPDYPEELPVSAMRDEIAAAIRARQVVIVCGETGS